MGDQELWKQPVTYGSIGATQAADLLSYPPAGYRAYTARTRIGHGDARWEYACTEIFTWGIQRRAGLTIDIPDRPATPEGLGLIAPGLTAVLGAPFGPFRVRAPVRVVYVIDEPMRKGFAYGTLAGHPENGEELFVVERTADGSVWLVIRAFSRPATRGWRLVAPALRVTQWFFTRRYLRALSGQLN